jgi:hypothetical protein
MRRTLQSMGAEMTLIASKFGKISTVAWHHDAMCRSFTPIGCPIRSKAARICPACISYPHTVMHDDAMKPLFDLLESVYKPIIRCRTAHWMHPFILCLPHPPQR